MECINVASNDINIHKQISPTHSGQPAEITATQQYHKHKNQKLTNRKKNFIQHFHLNHVHCT